jgi:hypothetical protein
MALYLTAQEVDEVPRTASVSDYDQLSENQQETVRRLAAGEAVGGEAGFDGDVIRFTSYYRVNSTGRQASD